MKIRAASIMAILVLVLAASCGKNNCKVPIGDANCSIFLHNPDAYPLGHPGGMVFAHGGHRGLWVVNTGLGYAAYEATCPNCLDVAVEATADYEGVLKCPKCSCLFNTYSDGTPFDPNITPCPLYQYGCREEGGYLRIYN